MNKSLSIYKPRSSQRVNLYTILINLIGNRSVTCLQHEYNVECTMLKRTTELLLLVSGFLLSDTITVRCYFTSVYQN